MFRVLDSRHASGVPWRRFFHGVRTEGAGPGREAAAIGIGVFLGCTPFYGFHLLLCLAAGTLLRLNRLKIYLAANISNPLMAPVLILGELQAGALARRGEIHALTLDAVRRTDPWRYAGDLLTGSAIVGGMLGIGAAAATWMLARSGRRDPLFADLVRRASDRYVTASITAWEFARGKLRGDPIYRSVVFDGLLPPGGTLVDIGCGSGLTLALLAECADAARAGRWPPGRPPPPLPAQMVGIEIRPRAARLARLALEGAATIHEGDARETMPPEGHAVLLFDVLQMMPAEDQTGLLAAAARRLAPGGVILVREADAGAGWRFRAVQAGNRLKALVFGHWRQSFHFRTAGEWAAVFERLGFQVARRSMGTGTPFANVLFSLTAPAGEPGSSRRP
jgi:SAM-dependent methyltransferase